MSEYMKSEEAIRFEMIINDEMQEAEYSEERTSSRSHKQMNNKRFRKEYMTIPKFSKWLQGVTSDEKRFYCIFCEKTFLGGKWEINKHHNSTKHQNKSEKFETIHTNKPDEESNVLFVQSNNHKRFKDEYVELPGCHAWLQKVADDPRKFFCKHCQKEMLGGKWEVMKHQRSKRHQHMSDKVYKSSLIDADELVNYEDDAEMLDDVANFSGESEGQIEYLKYEEFEDPNQNHSVEQENADEIPPTMNEFSEITEVNADYCDFTIMLEQLYGESYNSFDVALHSYDGTVRAHRSVLAACSEFFRVLFKSSIHFEIEPIINIYLPDYSSSTIQLLIKFLYSGQIVLPPELVNEFADICHELNVNTINSNFNSSTTTREHQDYVQIVEDLSNKLNCKRVLPQAEQLPIEVPDSDSSSDFVDLDDNYLAYKRFCKKKLKKKKGKTLDNRMDLALIEVLAGEEPLAAAKKFQITTNDLIDYVSRYKNIQQMTNNIPTVTIPTVYKIKRAQEGDLVSNDEELYEVQKPWDFQNSNRPSSSGLATVLVNNAAENQIRHPKTLTLQIFNK